MKTVEIGSLALNVKGAFKIGPFGSSLKKSELVSTGIPVAGIENVLPNHFVRGFRRFIGTHKFAQLSDYEILAGDILVTTMGTIGRSAVAPIGLGTAIFDSHLFRMRVDNNLVDPYYLCYAINSDLVVRQLSRMARGAIMEGLNTTILKRCIIPLPELSDQQRVVQVLGQAVSLRSHQREALRQADHLFYTLLHQVFGGELLAVLDSRPVQRKPSVPARKRTYSPGVFYRRAAIEAYVINALHGDQYLGRTKLEKIDHLIEYHCGIDLERYPMRDAAGPDDYPSRMKVEHLADKRNWFRANDKKDGSIVKYLPKRGFASAANKGAQEIGERRNAVDNLLELMRPLDTKRCEIIATLYAAWNDLLLVGKAPSDAEIVHDVLHNWRPEKQLIPERRWLRGLKWMRDNGLVPDGRGKPVLRVI